MAFGFSFGFVFVFGFGLGSGLGLGFGFGFGFGFDFGFECEFMFSTVTQAAQNLQQGTTTDIGHLYVHCVQKPSKLRGSPPRWPSKTAWSPKSISANPRLYDSDRREFLLYFYFEEVSGQKPPPKKPKRLQSPSTLPQGR